MSGSGGTVSAPRPVSGEQYLITRDRFRAQVGQVGAVLRGFWAGSRACTETWDDEVVAPMGCGLVLVPWPNRVAGGRWERDGASLQLDLTEPSAGNATHGLLRNTVYLVTAHTDSSVTLAASIYPQHGYPFILDTSVTYRLTEGGLTVTHRLTNSGSATAPFGVGAHPYLRVGEIPAADLRITVSAQTMADTDAKLIPTGTRPVVGTALDLRGGSRVGDLDANTAFTDLAVTDGRIEHRVDAPDGTAVVLWADPVFGWVQVFTPANFPGPGSADQRYAVAIEPMTCPADALNSGHGLLHVAPGQTWAASWGLRPEGF